MTVSTGRALWAGAALALAACTKSPPPATNEMAGMPGMNGMAGMPMSGDSGVPLDRPAAHRLGIGFARAMIRPLRQSTRLPGTLTYAEPRKVYVNAHVDGWVERLYADYSGKPVEAGDALLDLYSPELVSAQEEFLAARRIGDSTLVAAARRRLVLWNIADQDIAALAERGLSQRTLPLRAPRNGEIAEKMVIQGQAVHAGDNLFLIADRSVLWVDVAVFEMDAPVVRIGTPVSITVDALPGRRYTGRVTFIQPSVDPRSRTLTARIEVPNPDRALRPGMYATATLLTTGTSTLTVPVEAVLPTGTADLVFVRRGDGRFAPRAVVVGARNDSLVEIRQGLKAGDEVVASATYLLDSESNLAAAMQGLMLQMGMGLNNGGMQAKPDSVHGGRP